MRPASELLAAMKPDENWVVLDTHGARLDVEIGPSWGPATLLVREMTDAVKLLGPDGSVAESIDRSRLAYVEAFALNRVVLRRLGDLEMSARELFDKVRATGLAWQVTEAPELSSSPFDP